VARCSRESPILRRARWSLRSARRARGRHARLTASATPWSRVRWRRRPRCWWSRRGP